jgi:hypothetical protein
MITQVAWHAAVELPASLLDQDFLRESIEVRVIAFRKDSLSDRGSAA